MHGHISCASRAICDPTALPACIHSWDAAEPAAFLLRVVLFLLSSRIINNMEDLQESGKRSNWKRLQEQKG